MKKFIVNLCHSIINRLDKKEKPVDNIKTYKPISLGSIVLNNKTIPKIVYVVNVFDEEPLWYKCCIRSIQKTNPDFKIQVLTYTQCGFFNVKYVEDILNTLNTGVDIDHLINLYKQKLIFETGGFAISGKIFAIKPFDDLLNCKSFVYSRLYNNQITKDYNFVGSIKGFWEPQSISIPAYLNHVKYNSLKFSFENGLLDNDMLQLKNTYMTSHIYDFN